METPQCYNDIKNPLLIGLNCTSSPNSDEISLAMCIMISFDTL